MENNKSRIGVTDIIQVVLTALYLIGIRTFFSACGPKEDGSWMTCHWAGQAITGVALVLLVVAVIHLIVADPKTKTGLSIATIPAALLGIAIPGGLIGLCMMNTMHCHTVMRPAAIILSVLVIVTACADIMVQKKRS